MRLFGYSEWYIVLQVMIRLTIDFQSGRFQSCFMAVFIVFIAKLGVDKESAPTVQRF